jgi:hypothetical protein
VERHLESPDRLAGRKVRKPVGYGSRASAADRDLLPIEHRRCRQTVTGSGEDPLRGVERRRHPAVLVCRERAPRRTSALGEIGLRQTSRLTCLRQKN